MNKRTIVLVGMTVALILAPQVCAEAIIIDHNCTDLSQIPEGWIDVVQDDIKLHYAHTSHGGQLTTGLQRVENSDSNYSQARGSKYLPTEADALCIFDGQEHATYITPDGYWDSEAGRQDTQDVTDHNPAINVSMWSWCCQLTSYSAEHVQTYLDVMGGFETSNPDVRFVYMTCNAQATGGSGYNRYLRNEQIRSWVRDHPEEDRILFDFADLDSWWYNSTAGEWEHATYEYSSTEIPVEHSQFNGNQAGHTTYASCEQKGKAVWHTMARLAGWDGGQADGTIYVNTSGWWIDPAQFNASSDTPIQDAINNATDGDRIYVYAGDYTENVLVDKRLTLEGEGRDVVTVQAASVAEHVFNVTADYVNLSGFGVTGATDAKKTGIYLGNGADHCNVSYNNVSGSNRGIYLYHSSNNTLQNNIVTGNTYNFGVYGAELPHHVHDIDTSNTVDGKPIYYWVDLQDQEVPDDAGFVGLVNCKNITVRDLTLTKGYQGVLLAYSNDSRIDNVTAPNNYFGIHLKYSSNNSLTGNTASNGDYGIYLQYSSNNSLTGNIANSNTNYNLELVDSSCNNMLADNNASDGDYCGIVLAYSSNNNTLTNNTANRNPGYSGILLYGSCDHNTLTNNTANRNYIHAGIFLYGSCNHNNLTGNTANSNNVEYAGILLHDSCNHNNLTGNTANSNTGWYAGAGISLWGSSSNNTIAGNTANENSHYGLHLDRSSNNTLTSNNASSNSKYGIHLDRSSNNTLTSNNASSNSKYGIHLDRSSNNTLTNNTVNSNTDYGIYMTSSSNNTIYNNYFNNTNNAWENGNNIWNTTPTPGPNIIGGPYIGGNYWSDYTGVDGDGDGFGDTPYTLSGSNKDRLPLVRDICGDVDGNMTVDTADLQLLLERIFAGTQITRECAGDVDGSGTINILDARLLMNHLADRGAYPLNCAC